ncbi:PH domain-containing protein [Agromyces sp. NPDC056523]|uniref:PH domain-containing protein n=1 Tax=Agromyces sp. NPDC056523 TaxID=3345850 RepID=UPI00366E47D0
MFDPRVERHLIADEGEVIVDEVAKHWAAIVKPLLELILAIPVFVLAFYVPPQAWWLPALGGAALTVHALWRILQMQMDRFVITNMRVFRVHGILTQNIATMPLARILDISVHRPFVGRIFNFGHFIFESAAQTQGLKEIRYVGDPNERDLTIQRVIARAGLRGPVRNGNPGPFNTQPLLPPPPPATPPTPPAPVVQPVVVALGDPFDDDGTGETLPEPPDPNDTQPIPRI